MKANSQYSLLFSLCYDGWSFSLFVKIKNSIINIFSNKVQAYSSLKTQGARPSVHTFTQKHAILIYVQKMAITQHIEDKFLFFPANLILNPFCLVIFLLELGIYKHISISLKSDNLQKISTLARLAILRGRRHSFSSKIDFCKASERSQGFISILE